MVKKVFNKLKTDEQGQALAIVLILLLVGGLIITPLLGLMSAGLISRQVVETNMMEFYAADSGVEDALWKIKEDELPEWIQGTWDNDTFSHEPYQYSLAQTNGKNVTVEIDPIWILDGLGEECLGENYPQGAIPHQEFLVVGDTMGVVNGNGLYQIGITYLGTGNTMIQKIGVWLPEYAEYAGNNNLGFEPEQYPRRGGTAVVWNFSSPGATYNDLPDGDSENQKIVTFEFTPYSDLYEAFSWIRVWRSDVYLSWDADAKIFKILSTAVSPDSGTDTTIETYLPKNELREMSAAVQGDYRAIGNSIMIETTGDRMRDTLLDESSTTISDIPDDADVYQARLYWSGWVKRPIDAIWQDTCETFANWTGGIRWSLYNSEELRGQGSGTISDRTITMTNPVDLSSHQGGTIFVSWDQRESGSIEPSDYLKFSFSSDNGMTWSADNIAFGDDDPDSPFSFQIPDEYLTATFKMRFYLDFNDSSEYAYIDNITISDGPPVYYDESAIFKINGNQVYFDEYNEPQEDISGTEEITADRIQVINNLDYGNPHGRSYSSYKDVTALVETFSNHGNASYTVGSVYGESDANDEWAYAGWSLVIIYRSTETTGHSLYIYDDFLYKDHDDTFLDFDQDGDEGGTIGGFLVPEPVAGEVIAAKMTAFVGEGDSWYSGDYLMFNGTKLPDDDNSNGQGGTNQNNVWNGQSLGMSADGVDVDTFYVRWDDNLLLPGDTSAEIEIWTETDIWNLVYLIVSFRSESKVGGNLVYLVR